MSVNDCPTFEKVAMLCHVEGNLEQKIIRFPRRMTRNGITCFAFSNFTNSIIFAKRFQNYLGQT